VKESKKEGKATCKKDNALTYDCALAGKYNFGSHFGSSQNGYQHYFDLSYLLLNENQHKNVLRTCDTNACGAIRLVARLARLECRRKTKEALCTSQS